MAAVQQQIDELTRTMLKTFDDPIARAIREAIGMSDNRVRELIAEQRRNAGLPENPSEK